VTSNDGSCAKIQNNVGAIVKICLNKVERSFLIFNLVPSYKNLLGSPVSHALPRVLETLDMKMVEIGEAFCFPIGLQIC
jgi:hypothetical protein